MTPSPELQDILRGLPSTEAASLARVWNLLTPPDCPECPDERVHSTWAQIDERRRRTPPVPHDPPRPISLADRYERPPHVRVSRGRRALRWGVPAFTLAAVVGLGWWLVPTTVSGVGTHLLPDGSTATLSEGAQIRYARSSGRSIALAGEATFDVVRDPSTPFVVTTPNARVEVLGTLFTVSAPASGATRVDVSRGRVAVSARAEGARPVEVVAGRYTRVAGTTVAAPAYSLEATMSSVHADGVPLGTFADSLGARYGIRIALPDSLRRLPWTLHLDGPVPLTDALRAIGAPLSLGWTTDTDGNVTFAPRR